ncbi:unnamed protein product [Mytilus edulis]|uniref:SWIM-type domain-containing protein n=1 Tax=Mytilus edulis TaxID=6550 RepID=A0A8S3QIY4_MYTED|nr:unnamed protein product [Mytilus edulis]
MLHSDNEEEFLDTKLKLTSKWTPVVLEHFNKHICPAIQNHSGKWLIEKYPGMFDPYSGITNNLSESMNAVLKRENDWKELPVDLLALGFYYIQNFENYEILRGRSGLGNYHLKKEFSRAFISPSDVIFPKRIVSPDEVIEYLKNDKPLFQSNSFQSDTDPLGNLNSQEIIKQTNSDENTSTNQVKLENNEVIVNQQPVIEYPTDSSQQSLARFIVDNNLITLVPQQGAFIVNGRKGKYCVTLFPKETCQCESSSTCFHILAAKISIGLESTQTKYMREHLIHCLENGKFTHFPKNYFGKTPKNLKTKTHIISINCDCGKPDTIEDMVGCEGKTGRKMCDVWTHRSCAKNMKGNSWFCEVHR